MKSTQYSDGCRWRRWRVPGALLALVMLLATGCNRNDLGVKTAAIASPAPAVSTPATPAAVTETKQETPTPIKDALVLLFAKEAEEKNSPFPKGTHLIRVEVSGKKALVDVSKEFNGLLSRGESTEGAAQKKMCKTLAQFENLETMHVTVEGKEYDSQAADWTNIPLRVRGEQVSGSVDR